MHLNTDDSRMRELEDIASSKGGNLLSKEWGACSNKLKWSCIKGHIFDLRAKYIRIGQWCPECRLVELSDNLHNDLNTIASSKGGTFTWDGQIWKKEKINMTCANSHTWEATIGAILAGRWCRICHNNKIRSSLTECQEIAKSKGGECLSKEYHSAHHNLIFRCALGHEWECIANSIRRGTWCDVCVRAKRKTSI